MKSVLNLPKKNPKRDENSQLFIQKTGKKDSVYVLNLSKVSFFTSRFFFNTMLLNMNLANFYFYFNKYFFLLFFYQTVCHSCLIKHLRTEQYCPRCEMMINTAKPNIK